MPDNPVIRVEADSEQVSELIKVMQSANSTMKQSADAAKQLTTIAKENATAQALLNGEWRNAGTALTEFRTRQREVNQEMSGYSNVIKNARQEHRLYMFALLEGMRVFDAFGGKNKELTQGLETAAGAALGMKFAMDAMGVAASASGPIAVLIGVFTALNMILKDNSEELRSQVTQMTLLEGKGQFQTEAMLRSNVTAAQTAENELYATRGKQRAAGLPEAFGVTQSDLNAAHIKTLQAQKALNDFQMEYLNGLEKQAENNYKIVEKKKEIDRQNAEYAERSATVGAVGASGFLPFQSNTADMGSDILTRIGYSQSITGVSGTEPPTADDTNKGKTGDAKFAEPIAKGFDVVGSAIERNIVQKLGTAHSVFQQFVQGFSAGLLSLAEQILSKLAIFEIFNLLTGGAGFAGIGVAGGLSQFLGFGGNSGTQGYSPNPNSGGGYSDGSPVVKIQGVLKSGDIYMSGLYGKKHTQNNAGI